MFSVEKERQKNKTNRRWFREEKGWVRGEEEERRRRRREAEFGWKGVCFNPLPLPAGIYSMLNYTEHESVKQHCFWSLWRFSTPLELKGAVRKNLSLKNVQIISAEGEEIAVWCWMLTSLAAAWSSCAARLIEPLKFVWWFIITLP